MSIRCYHCHMKFSSGTNAVDHCFADHCDKEIIILKPENNPDNNVRRGKYKTWHYGRKPKDIQADGSSYQFDEITWELKCTSPLPKLEEESPAEKLNDNCDLHVLSDDLISNENSETDSAKLGIVNMAAVNPMDHHEMLSAKEKDFKLTQKPAKQKDESWRTLCYDFTQSTSMMGLRFITLKTRFIMRRLLWILCTLGAVAAIIYYVYYMTDRYLHYHKNVNFEVNYVKELDFPAVTLCNKNQFKLTPSVDGGYYGQVIKFSQPATSAASIVCKQNEFKCDNKCIPSARKCDGVADCKDGTDEQRCDSEQCSYISIMTSSTLEDTSPYSGILNHNFQRDQSMSTYSRWLYYSLSDNDIVYLFYEDKSMKWIFSKSLNRYSIILSTQSNDHANTIVTPDKYVGTWANTNSKEELTLNIICTEPMPEVQNISTLARHSHTIHNLKDIYDYGAHILDDVDIQGCTWKGQACSAADFDIVDTDSGRCLSFKPKGQIEQSGPGFGLRITVNIQLYEYIGNLLDSTGMEILLHDPGVPPVMTEKAFTITPGLNTLVAIDRTQIQNLEPPWGKCEEKKLEYYANYSVSTCHLDCLIQLARSKCGCRELYMPRSRNTSKIDTDPYCTMKQYLNCWKPNLDKLKMYGNNCTCATPCSEMVLVPSLSFSSISTNTDALSGDERQKLLEIEKNVTNAREIQFRILEEKFLETMRQFTTTIRQSALTATRHLVVEETILQELSSIKTMVADVNGDCLWFMQQQHTLTLSIDIDLSHIINNLYHFLRETLYVKTAELSYLLTSIYKCWDADMCGYQNKTDRENLIYNDMLRPWYTQTKNRITFIRNEIITQTIQNITDVLDANSGFSYVLDAGHMQPLFSYLRVTCGDWCTEDESSVVTLLSDKLQKAIKEVATMLTVFETALDTLHSDSLKDGSFLAWNDIEARSTLNMLNTKATDLTTQVSHLLSIVTHSMSQPMKKAVTVMKDLLRAITPKCDLELHRLYYGYLDEHNKMHDHVIEMKNLILEYGQQYRGFHKQYKAYNLSLTELYAQSNLTTTIASIQNLNYQMVSSFEERVISVQRIRDHISSIYYWLSAQAAEETLASTSLLWQRFHISSPVLADTGATATVGTPIEATYSFSNADLTSFWEQTVDTLETSRVSMEEGNTAMETQLTGIQEYLETFIMGNQISESFFKNNFLSVDIFYKELTDKKVVQQKAHELLTTLGEIGGFMGLLLGFSLFTILEFLDLLLYNGASKCFTYIKNKRQVKDSSTSDEPV